MPSATRVLSPVLLAFATVAAAAALLPAAARAQAAVPPALPAELQAVAGPYPVVGVTIVPGAAARVVVEDSSIAAVTVDGPRWMLGPPVTAAEADGCPPEKVLGRRIARALWRGAARQAGADAVVVEVRGTGAARFQAVHMYYYRPQLERSWAGDAHGRPRPD